MIACLDVQYDGDNAHAAGVAFQNWGDVTTAFEKVVMLSNIAPYVPGQFFLRELPSLLAVLKSLPPVNLVLIDAYVWLGEKPGLGAHLHEALGGNVSVVGIAKTKFHAAQAVEITRGSSVKPLFITAAGIDAAVAAEHVRTMHGSYRVPTLIKRVDRLARESALTGK